MAPTTYVITCSEISERNHERTFFGCDVILVTTSEEYAKEIWNEETERCQEKGKNEFDTRIWTSPRDDIGATRILIYKMHMTALD